MDENYLVTKSNYFIMNSHYDLSFQEQKIILTLASMVQPEDTEFKEYKFKIKDFIKLLGLKDQGKYTEVPKITKELMKKVFEIKEGKDIIQLAWLSSARYKTGEGTVVLKFDSNLKPYMLQLNTVFTNYKLANILSMKSKYSPRIYEILKCNEYKKQGYIEIEISELRKLLKTEKIYPLYNDLKRKIIEKAQKELKKLTDISFEFEEIKTGRKVTALKFYIHSTKSDNKAREEVCVTTEKSITEVEKSSSELTSRVKDLFKEDITSLEAKSILDIAKGDINIIKEKYVLAQNVDKIGSVVGWMLRAIMNDYQAPKGKTKEGTFNNYEQRKYDGKDGGMTYKTIENKLLGWEENEKDGVGEEFQQAKY